ncbi:MAG: TrkH family potassium uptake protein [Candidatus Bathyarchaeia archaeon]
MTGVLSTVSNNLGFILQFNGVVTLAPLFVAFALQEQAAFQALALTVITYLVLGFLLARAKQGDLNFKTSYALILSTFLVIGLIGAIPYLVLGNSIFQLAAPSLVDSLFDSVSGYTTTGMTIISNPETIPQSLILFRSIQEWVGGISIIFLLILFLNATGRPSLGMAAFGKFERLKPSTQKTFIELLKIYGASTVVFIAVLTTIGGVDPFDSFNLVFTGVATGGFVPRSDLSTALNPSAQIILMVLMILGATNFAVAYRAFLNKPKGLPEKEFVLFLSIMAIVTVVLVGVAQSNGDNASWLSTSFLSVSAATTTGFQLLPISTISEPQKILLVLLMFIGGMSFSTAGGMKVFRLFILGKSIPWVGRKLASPVDAIIPLKLGESRLLDRDVIYSYVFVGLAILVILVFTIVFMIHGFAFIDSLFTVTSAFGNVGLTVGVAAVGLDPILKSLLIAGMILGRIEILPLVVVLRMIFR